MALSAFDDPATSPGPADLSKCLGGSARLWKKIVADVGEACPPIAEVWAFAGAKFGWSLRLKRADRVLLYLTPQEGRFLVGVVLGEKAVSGAREAGVTPAVLALLDAAPRYAEGRGIRLTIAAGDDVEDVRRLVALKTAAPSKVSRPAAAPRRASGRLRGGR